MISETESNPHSSVQGAPSRQPRAVLDSEHPTFVNLLKRSLARHWHMRSYRPYEKFLRHLRQREDVWVVSQGEYMDWWRRRCEASLDVHVSGGMCTARTSLTDGVIEKYPGEFFEAEAAVPTDSSVDGEVWVTIDERLAQKELLRDVLRQEGIFNVRFGEGGPIFLPREDFESLLGDMERRLRGLHGHLRVEDVARVRELLVSKLNGLPLFRIWYHPRVRGTIMRSVFSPRYDVDRAITNLRRIRKLEERYDVRSTLYFRAFCPFYSSTRVREVSSQPWCSEVALHGEFVKHSAKFESEEGAAAVERARIEDLTGQKIQGVCMHGGEGIGRKKASDRTPAAIESAGLTYDTTTTVPYYLPFRRVVDGRISSTFALSHAFCDIEVVADAAYGKNFYEEVVAALEDVHRQNGVFVLQLHPVYFGFFRYLFNPVNWAPLASFLLSYLLRKK